MKLLPAAVALLSLAAGTSAASPPDCPGYSVSNIIEAGGILTADLKLAGDACDIYGTDLVDLKLLVEYQTG